MDILAKDMLDPLKDGGPLDRISGLDLASGPLTVNPSNADFDLDGIVDPNSVYWEGVEAFYKRIRGVLGPDRVLTTSLDFRYLKYINGVNQEGLAEPDDPWDEVTETVNEVLAWRKLSHLPMISLAFQQHMSRDEDLLRVQMQRLLNGYSVCLGMAADIETGSGNDALDALKRIELYKGDAKASHWLGKAISMRRTALMTPNILGNALSPSDWSRIIPALAVKRGSLSIEGDELILAPQSKNFPGYVTLDLDFTLAGKTDFTVFMEAKSDDDQAERRIMLPRVSVSTDTKPLRAEFTSKDYLPLTFFIRGASGGRVTIDFRFSAGGPIRFKALSVHAATDALACEFERGVVVVNPSLVDEEFDLTNLFPGRGGFRRISASEPVGSSSIPDKYRPQLRQAMELNNGQQISNYRSVEVPQRNSLFLIADSVSSSGSVVVSGFELLSDQSSSEGDYADNSDENGPSPRPTPYQTRMPTWTPSNSSGPSATLQNICLGNSCGKLQKCKGDCDNDDDCTGDLVCFQRNVKTTKEVYGCKGLASGGTDYCVNRFDFPEDLHIHISSKASKTKNNIFDRPNLSRPDTSYPTRTPTSTTMPTPSPTTWPTPIPTPIPTTRVTPLPTKRPTHKDLTLAKVCKLSDSCQGLQQCDGDCDKNTDCVGNLVCYQRGRKSRQKVPGCKGLAKEFTDFCVDKDDLYS